MLTVCMYQCGPDHRLEKVCIYTNYKHMYKNAVARCDANSSIAVHVVEIEHSVD